MHAHTPPHAAQAVCAAAPPWPWRLLTPGLIAALAGVALQLQQPALDALQTYMLFCALALSVIALAAPILRASDACMPPGRSARWRTGLATTMLLGALALLGYASAGWRAVLRAESALADRLQGIDLRVVGTVADLPQRFDAGSRFVLDVLNAQHQGQPVQLPPRLRLAWYARNSAERWSERPTDAADGARPSNPDLTQAHADPHAVLRPGQRLRLTVRLKQPHGAVNPHGFDAELRDWIQGIHAVGYVRDGARDDPVQTLGQPSGYPVAQARFALRQRLLQHTTDPLPGGILAALLVGDQAAIPTEAWSVFRATGVSHLMAISGMHITLFAWLAALLVGALWRRSAGLCQRWPTPQVAVGAGLVLAGAYAVLTGWGVPAQRTVLMLGCVGTLRLAGLRWPWSRVWLLVCAVVVAADPWALMQSGFWLSFVAVGLLFATDTGASSADRKSLGARFIALLREQGVITLALAPLTLLLFGQVSLVGLLANLVAIPWITLGVVPLTLAGALWPPLWSVAQAELGLLMQALSLMAQWPWALAEVAAAPLWAAAAALLGALLVVLRLPLPLRALGVLCMLPQALWQPPGPAPGQFSVLGADVGQGSAVLVRTAHHALLFDAGPRYSPDADAGHRILVPLLRALGVRLDALVLSHRDSDHVGGAAAVLASQAQAQVISPVDAAALGLDPAQPVLPCAAGRRWVWDGVAFEMLHPLPGASASARQTNALSCVLRVATTGPAPVRAVLLTGDIEKPQEAQLVQRMQLPPDAPPAGLATAPGTAVWRADLRADVLLAPHHGSKSSSSEALLRAVQPRWVWVQAGYRNRFGHPAPAVLARYAAEQRQVMDTVHCGALQWRSDQPERSACQRDQDARYWHHRAAPWVPQTQAGPQP
ncbi:MAG: DNA internalization-related competence protein ComEC/Rec2 [Rhodoferax sp.]